MPGEREDEGKIKKRRVSEVPGERGRIKGR